MRDGLFYLTPPPPPPTAKETEFISKHFLVVRKTKDFTRRLTLLFKDLHEEFLMCPQIGSKDWQQRESIEVVLGHLHMESEKVL